MAGIRWRSLGTRIIAWFFFPTVIILVAVALVTFYAYQQVTEELVIERDQELTLLSANQLAEELADYTDLLTTLARTASIYQNDLSAQQDALKVARNRLSVFDGGVVILDTFGIVMAVEPERQDILGQDWSDRAFYHEILESQIINEPRPVYSAIDFSDLLGEEEIAAAVSITSETGEFLGVLLGLFRVNTTAENALYDRILELRYRTGGSIYLVDGNGRVIYHTDANRIGEDFSTSGVPQAALSDQTSARRTQDYQGRDIVASYASVANTSWMLVTEESWADLTAGSRSYQNFLILLLVLGVIAPAFVVGIGTRRVMQPIDDLIQAAKQVAQGNFGQTINAQTGDEIEELSRQFNLMSAQLHESYTNLEQRVADRTMELATLNAIAAVTSRSLDLQEILHDALNKTLEALAIEAGGVYLLQAEGDVLFAAAHQGIDDAIIAELDRQQADEEYLGRVIQSCEPLIVEDASQDPILTCLVAHEPDFHSVAYIPLISRQKVLGVMFTVTRGYRHFSHQEIELLISIGQQVGVVVENAWLFTKAEKRLQELEALYRADEELYRHLRLDQVLQTLVNVALDILQADKSSLLVWDDRTQRLVVRASRGFDQKTLKQMSFALGEGTVGLVAATGEPAIVEDTSEDPQVLKRIIEPEGIRSLMNVPIKIAGRVFGVFNVDYMQPRAYGEEEKRLFIALAQRAALTIENAQLYEQAQQAAVLEERQRLARDLHDAVTQTLFSASLIAEVLPRLWENNIEEGWRRLEELRQLTRGALAEMRTLLVELRPAAIMEAELKDLLRQLTEAMTARARVASEVEIGAESPLPDDVKVAFYRIAQEALNNVVKHAEADNVQVSLTETIDGVEMFISDDGCGYDPEDVSPEHLGLGIMRERAGFIGADLEVETQVDCGTKVLVRWKRPDGSEESA